MIVNDCDDSIGKIGIGVHPSQTFAFSMNKKNITF